MMYDEKIIRLSEILQQFRIRVQAKLNANIAINTQLKVDSEIKKSKICKLLIFKRKDLLGQENGKKRDIYSIVNVMPAFNFHQ